MTKMKWNFYQRIKRAFTSHPKNCGETYLEHFITASSCGIELSLAGMACIIHSMLPFLFTSTASSIVQKINARLALRKNNGSLS